MESIVTFNPGVKRHITLAFILKAMLPKTTKFTHNHTGSEVLLDTEPVRGVLDAFVAGSIPVTKKNEAELLALEATDLLFSFIFSCSVSAIDDASLMNKLSGYVRYIGRTDEYGAPVDYTSKVGNVGNAELVDSKPIELEFLVDSKAIELKEVSESLLVTPDTQPTESVASMIGVFTAFRTKVATNVAGYLQSFLEARTTYYGNLYYNTELVYASSCKQGTGEYKDFILLLSHDLSKVDKNVIVNVADTRSSVVLTINKEGTIEYVYPNDPELRRVLHGKLEKLKELANAYQGKHNNLSLLRLITSVN